MTSKKPAADDKVAARSAAARRLREEYADRYRELMIEEHEKRGVEYQPRLTDEEKAERTVKDLLARYPNLRVDLP